MLGERLVLSREQYRLAEKLEPLLIERAEQRPAPLVVALAGESGSGKSGLAFCLLDRFRLRGWECLLLCLDDYYRLPPARNRLRRQQDEQWLGEVEIDMETLSNNIEFLRRRPPVPLEKPLVVWDRDVIEREVIEAREWDLVIIEGSHALRVPGVDWRVLLERSAAEARRGRLRRGREVEDSWLAGLLSRERRLVLSQRRLADVVIRDGEIVTTRRRVHSMEGKHGGGSTKGRQKGGAVGHAGRSR